MITRRKLIKTETDKLMITNGQQATLFKEDVPYIWMKAVNDRFSYGPYNEFGKPIRKETIEYSLTEAKRIIPYFMELNKQNDLKIEITELHSE